MALKEAVNEVYIEGILAEIDLRDNLDGDVKAGRFIVQVSFSPEAGEEVNALVPIEFYAAPLTKKGTPNPAYKSIVGILDGAKTLADGFDEKDATKIRCSKAKLRENLFMSRDGKIVSTTRINGSFFDKVKNTDFKPEAHFKARIVVSKIEDEMKRIEGEMTETGALQVTGLLVQWGGTIDEVKFLVKNKKYIDAIQKHWNQGDTVNAAGYLRFVTETDSVTDGEDGFGVAQPKVYTRNIKEYVINNGSVGAIEDGYDEDEITDAVLVRRQKITELQDKEEGSSTTSSKKEEKKKPSKDRGW